MTQATKEYIITEIGMNLAIAVLKANHLYDTAESVLKEIRPHPAPATDAQILDYWKGKEDGARQTREKTIEEIWLHVQSFCDPMTEDYLKSLRSTRHIEQQPAILPNPEMGRFDP